MGHGANAGGWTEDVTRGALALLGRFCGVIIDVLGRLIIIVVNVLIFFASYNDFLKSQAVETGWPLVRDVVNMFFIVVLLVSAFSTIIGYKEFHYTKVLPRLLLMAVLINFSKTLIGLMIDFSQVLMLTFVNAFKQAAGGNFVTALQLDKATSLRDIDTDDKNVYDLTQLIGASVLAVILLGVALTLVVIMTAFIAFRIVGLWLLIIMSPMAFFAWALPGKMQKAFSAFTDSFWSRLSTLLIAGPAMAFFLWLALAIAQGQKPFMETMGNNTELDSNAGSASFVSKVGTPSEIGSFIVAVILMLQGVEFAVKQSSAISSSLGKFATAVSSGGGAAVHLARGAARISGKVSKVGFEGVDRLTNIRGGIGKIGMRAMPFGIGAETFAGMAGARGKREAAREARGKKILGAATTGLSIEKRLEMEQLLTKSGNRAVARQAQISVSNSLTTGPGRKALVKQEIGKLAKERPDLSEDERKVRAEGLAKRRAASEISLGIRAAEDSGDDTALERYGEALKKDPGLFPDLESLGGVANARPENIREFLKTKQAEAFTGSGPAFALLSAIGAMKSDGSVDKMSEGWEELGHGGGGDRLAYIDKHLSSTSEEDRAVQLKAMKKGATAKEIEAAEKAGSFVGKGQNGQILSVQLSQAAPNVNVAQKFVRNEQAIQASLQRANAAPRGSREAPAFRGDAMVAGATIQQAFNLNAETAKFETPEHRQEFGAQMKQLNEKLDKTLTDIQNFDIDSLTAKLDGVNEARSEFVAAIDPEKLRKAYEEAVSKGNSNVKAKLGQMMAVITREGERVEKEMTAKGYTKSKIDELIRDTKSVEGRVLAKASAIASNPKYRGMRTHVSEKATASARRAKEKGSEKKSRRQERDEDEDDET